MKNKTIYFVVLLLAGTIAFYSCEKNEKNNVRDLIVNNIWAYDTLSVSDVTNSGLMLAAAFLHLGFSGGEYDFNDNGTYTVTSELINESGSWELDDNKTLIMDKGTEDEFVMEILTINNSKAEFKVPMEGEIFTIPYVGYVILKFNAK